MVYQKYIELSLNGVTNRQVYEFGVARALFAKSNKVDCFRSMFSYDSSVLDHIKREGSIRGYDGAVFCDEIVIDFDGSSAGNGVDILEKPREEVLMLLLKLESLGIKNEFVEVYFSGRRGFHVSLSPRWFGITEAGYDVPSKVKHVVSRLTNNLTTVDLQIYHKAALIRVKGSLHSETGLYKTQIFPDELERLQCDQILKLGKSLRCFSVPTDSTLDGMLSFLLEDYKSPVATSQEVTVQTKVPNMKDAYGNKLCLLDILRGVAEGERDSCAIRLASYYRRLGFSLDQTVSYLGAWNKFNRPPLSEDELVATIKSAFNNPVYSYGCKDPILVAHCQASCFLYRKRNIDSTRIWNIYDMHEHYLAMMQDPDRRVRIDFDIMPNISRGVRGLRRGELLYIAARAGVGKSRIAQHICQVEAKRDCGSVVLFSLEMPIELVFERAMSLETGLDIRVIEQMYMEGNVSEFAKAVNSLGNLFVVEQTSLSLLQVCDVLDRIDNVHLVTIDYLGLLNEGGRSDYERVSAAAYGGKELAKNYRLPVIMLAQLSREAGDGTTPVSLTHLRDSGKIEESADTIIGLWKDTLDSNVIRASILKARKGELGATDLLAFDGHSIRVSIADTRKEII